MMITMQYLQRGLNSLGNAARGAVTWVKNLFTQTVRGYQVRLVPVTQNAQGYFTRAYWASQMSPSVLLVKAKMALRTNLLTATALLVVTRTISLFTGQGFVANVKYIFRDWRNTHRRIVKFVWEIGLAITAMVYYSLIFSISKVLLMGAATVLLVLFLLSVINDGSKHRAVQEPVQSGELTSANARAIRDVVKALLGIYLHFPLWIMSRTDQNAPSFLRAFFAPLTPGNYRVSVHRLDAETEVVTVNPDEMTEAEIAKEQDVAAEVTERKLTVVEAPSKVPTFTVVIDANKAVEHPNKYGKSLYTSARPMTHEARAAFRKSLPANLRESGLDAKTVTLVLQGYDAEAAQLV